MKTVKCSCGAVFKDELWASAEAQLKVHAIILAKGSQLSDPKHTKIKPLTNGGKDETKRLL